MLAAQITRVSTNDKFTVRVDPQVERGFEPVLARIAQEGTFSSSAEFNAFCRRAISIWEEAFSTSFSPAGGSFREVLGKIGGQIESPSIKIPTPWGGVLVEKMDAAMVNIEKFLAVKHGGYLAFEKHELKEETLQVREGVGLLVYQASDSDQIFLTVLKPGVEISFNPGKLHCIIGVEDLLVYEISKDHKGMDQDLIFLFEPDSK